MTYTSALMGIPRAAFESIADGFASAGYDREMVSAHPDNHGRVIRTIDMEGVMIFAEPGDTSDCCVNAGALSDAAVNACDDAFHAGFRACQEGQDMGTAWSNYTPAEQIVDALNGIT